MSKDDKKERKDDDKKKEKKLLEAIEKKLDRIARRQDEICSRLDRLEVEGSGRPGASEGPISRRDLITFLDQFRAGEALGEASLGAWIEVSDLACVRGGLRTVQQREGMHARLLEARIKELGGSPSFELPDGVYDRTMRDAGDAEKGDVQKVADFVGRFPDIDAALAPIQKVMGRLGDDDETRFLLHTIMQDERSTLEFFQQACELLSEGASDED